jgi:hypothetical protein
MESRIKFIYHEIELTRRCNSRCAHCLRGKAQARDISLEHLETFFQKTEMIECLTLTGGEVSLVPKLINATLDLAQKHNTKITHCGIVTNGLYVSDAFIEATRRWVNQGSFTLSISWDPYHKPVTQKNWDRLNSVCTPTPRSNFGIQPSGRATNLDAPFLPKCIDKPYWLLNGWIMQPTYLNALGEFVVIDGSYEEQPDYKIGTVDDMDYDMFLKIHTRAYGALHNGFGIIPPRWSGEDIIKVAKQGSPGPTVLQFCPYPDEVIYQVVGPEQIKKAS